VLLVWSERLPRWVQKIVLPFIQKLFDLVLLGETDFEGYD